VCKTFNIYKSGAFIFFGAGFVGRAKLIFCMELLMPPDLLKCAPDLENATVFFLMFKYGTGFFFAGLQK